MSDFSLFPQFLRGVLTGCPYLVFVEKRKDWNRLYEMSSKHSLVGLCFGGIEKLPHDQLPDMALLMDWAGQAEHIRTQNRIVNEAIAEIHDSSLGGYNGVVLKGQGLAQLYPRPELRTPGDIDLLIGYCYPSDELINDVIGKAKQNGTNNLHATYHHCDFGKIGDVEVETHWRASWFYTPWYNKRFQQFCMENLKTVEHKYGFPTPTLAFNRVYVLVHIYRHLFFEGIGLRQIIDYYYVLLRSWENSKQDDTYKELTQEVLKSLGMAKFTAAVMWVMKDALGMEDKCLLCEPNEQEGRFLLEEIMTSGNFGHQDERRYVEGANFAQRIINRLHRSVNLLRFGPMEVAWTPLWRTWHYLWMKKYN